MKKIGVLIALLLLATSVSVAAAPALPAADYAASAPLLMLDSQGALLLINREDSSYSHTDTPYWTLKAAVERNPGLLEQLVENQVAPAITIKFGRWFAASTYQELRGVNRILRDAVETQLGTYLEYVREELAKGTPPSAMEPFTAGWYNPGGVNSVVHRRKVHCAICGKKDFPSEVCFGSCVSGCPNSGNNCDVMEREIM